jgi:hypothetical protein
VFYFLLGGVEVWGSSNGVGHHPLVMTELARVRRARPRKTMPIKQPCARVLHRRCRGIRRQNEGRKYRLNLQGFLTFQCWSKKTNGGLRRHWQLSFLFFFSSCATPCGFSTFCCNERSEQVQKDMEQRETGGEEPNRDRSVGAPDDEGGKRESRGGRYLNQDYGIDQGRI